MEEHTIDEMIFRSSVLVCIKDGVKSEKQIHEWINTLEVREGGISPEKAARELRDLVEKNLVSVVKDSEMNGRGCFCITSQGQRYLTNVMSQLKRHYTLINCLLSRYEEAALSSIHDELDKKRSQWRNVRGKKLKRKEELLAQGLDKKSVKKEPVYKTLQKEQQQLSTVIKHIEKRLNRKIASIAREEGGAHS